MADFFGNLVGQVLGAAPEVGPLLPPRFAPWPGVALTGVAPRRQELVDAPARADAALFPPPLIDPDHPAIDTPLPSLRQMGALEPASGSPVQPDQASLARDTLETAAIEPGDVCWDAADTPPTAPPSGPTPSMAPDEPPMPPVLRAGAGGDTDAALAASPTSPGASGDRPSQAVSTTQRDQALPPAPDSAPRPAAGQERSAPPAELPDPPVNVGRLLHDSQAVRRFALDAEAKPVEAGPVEARPKPVEARPEPVEGHAVRRFALDWPEGRDAKPVEVQPVRRFALDWPEGRDAKLVEVQPELVEGRDAKPVAAHAVRRFALDADAKPVEAQPAPASAPLTVQPAAPVVQRQVAPLAPQPVPAAAADRPVSTQASAIPTPAAPDLITGPLEPAPPADRAVPGLREPTILPAPEAAWPTTGAPEPAPTVRVTIGRVEVRTAPPPPAPAAQRPRPARQTLSLDEYLQAGAGGQP